MTDSKRRRLIQAGVSVPLVGWKLARAQSADRNLFAAERKPAALVAAGTSLLVAPRRALVIGNSSYGFVSPLKNPANDAKAIGEELKRLGFEVVAALDLPRAQMLEAIHAYGDFLAREKAVGVFYYAGHGLQLAWRNYLVPVDAKIGKLEDIQAKCVDVNSVIEGIAKAANPMNVVILDACRENPFPEVKLEQKGLSQLDAPQATLLAYATAPGNLASDGDGANGLYTEYLLKEMQVPQAKIEDVFKRVRLAVRRKSNGQQLPWESTSLEDDFWFIPPPALQKIALEEAERQRAALAAERERQERIAKAQQAEAERLKREAEAERERQAAAERRRREELERAYQAELERRRKQEESDRAYEEELAFWNKVRVSSAPAPIEEYLKRYPSGRFSEIAQAQLDAILAREGEKKVEIAPQPQNPYTQGSATANTKYKVGDSYTYNEMDLYSRVVNATFTMRVTEISEREVIYNNGQIITDLLGNPVKARDGRTFSPNQASPQEFRVGKRWSSRFTGEHPTFGRFGASLEFRIVGKERISVPAGTFDCFRIEAHGESTGRTGVLTVANKLWVCPERLRRAVAGEQLRTFMGGRPAASERIELVAFQQA